MKILMLFYFKVYFTAMMCLGKLLAKKGHIKKAQRILINRSDRIGDAVLTVPLIRKLSLMGYQVDVIASKTNRFIFDKAGITVISECSMEPKNPAIEFLQFFLALARIVITKFGKRKPKYDVFLDLVYRFLEPVKNFTSFSGKTIGYAFGLHSLAYDYRLPYPHKEPMQKAIEKMIQLFEPSFSYVPSVSDFADFAVVSKRVSDVIPVERFIVFHIGGKKGRTIKEDYIVGFLNKVNLRTLVVDDPGKRSIKRVKERINNPNVTFVEDEFSLFELLTMTAHSNCILYIGHDGGHSHLLGYPTNSLMIFTMGQHPVWRPYTFIPWKKKEITPGLILERSELEGREKMILYRKTWLRPSHNISFDKLMEVNILDAWDLIISKVS